MMTMFKIFYSHLSESVSDVFKILFSSDMDVISDEAKKNFSNKEDMKAFSEAINKLREQDGRNVDSDGMSSATFKLHNNKEITLTR